ncbi:MAG: Lysine--tRNA ligase [Candidatus Thorarchaeota archaeon]|nr:MAG: Lysine--tRNA ligase [Candidatus Thorarchaeota archaeon]
MSNEVEADEFNIHWIKDVVDEVLARNVDEYVLSTGKSPSGSIHIGFVRELITSNVIKRELKDLGKKSRSLFVVDDYDPVRAFPPSVSLSLDEWVGVPYCDIPDEFGCCDSFGAHWANELIQTFPDFGLDPEIIWTSKLYETPEMLEAVRICLKETEIIREIMIKYVASDFNDEQRVQYLETMKDWYPASVLCPECGKFQAGAKGAIKPNRVTDYDVETDHISFECPGCGHKASVPLDSVRVKLTWRIDWPAKWYVLDVTCEPAGKDHSVKGGSYDTGLEVSRRIFDWPGPVKVPYEWVMIGGRDMGTSTGIVFSPKVWTEIAPPELYRFLMLKTDLQRTINIQPERVPDLVDNYDRFERVYYGLEDVSEEEQELARLLYPLSESRPVRDEYLPKLPFKFAVTISQLEEVIGTEPVIAKCIEVMQKKYETLVVSDDVLAHIRKRLDRALSWVSEFGSERDKIAVPPKVPDSIISTITEDDKKFLEILLGILRGPPLDDEELQSAIFESAREVGIKTRRAFVILYRILISSKSGPRIGPFLNMLGTKWVAKRIESII